jgi:hypothetical protein
MTTNKDQRMEHVDDSWNARGWDTFATFHDPDCVVYWPGREASPTHDGADHRAELIRCCEAFPDNRVHNRAYDIRFGEADVTCFVIQFAKAKVRDLARSLGCRAVDAGGLRMATSLAARALLDSALDVRDNLPWQSGWMRAEPTGTTS